MAGWPHACHRPRRTCRQPAPPAVPARGTGRHGGRRDHPGAVQGRGGPRGARGRHDAGGNRPARAERRRAAARLLPGGADRRLRRLRRGRHGRLAVGRMALGGAGRRGDAPARGAFGGGTAAQTAEPGGRGIHLPAKLHGPPGQGHPAEPEPVRQPVVAGAVRGRLPQPGRLPGRRDRDPLPGGARTGPARLYLHPARRAALPAADRPGVAEFYEGQGWPTERWLSYGVELDNAVIAAGRPATFGFHLCRGNQLGRWLVSGGYEPIAGPVFGRVDADRLLLEYDDERSGGFDPLRLVPEDKVIVLGLVTTKNSRVEPAGEIAGRLRQASSLVGRERLAISPQCGFATSAGGNPVTAEAQRGKLAQLVLVAEEFFAEI